MRDVKAYIDACLQGDNSDLQHVNRPLFFPSDFPGENVAIEWQPEDYNLIRQDGSLGELSAYQLPIKTKVTAVIIYDQEKEFYSKEICLTAPEKSDEEVLDEQIREAVQAADQRNLRCICRILWADGLLSGSIRNSHRRELYFL